VPAAEVDPSSVVVTNVHFNATPEDLGLFFHQRCGNVMRATILKNAHGMPKGYAYMQLTDASAAQRALKLSGTEFMGRTLRVRLQSSSFYVSSTSLAHKLSWQCPPSPFAQNSTLRFVDGWLVLGFLIRKFHVVLDDCSGGHTGLAAAKLRGEKYLPDEDAGGAKIQETAS
jgi:RNA recognition motif-containing protein